MTTQYALRKRTSFCSLVSIIDSVQCVFYGFEGNRTTSFSSGNSFSRFSADVFGPVGFHAQPFPCTSNKGKIYGSPSEPSGEFASLMCKCRCGSVELPEFPTSPTGWPRFTLSPTLTRILPG